LIQLFAGHPADPQAQNSDGRTPLQELQKWQLRNKKDDPQQWNGDPEATAVGCSVLLAQHSPPAVGCSVLLAQHSPPAVGCSVLIARHSPPAVGCSVLIAPAAETVAETTAEADQKATAALHQGGGGVHKEFGADTTKEPPSLTEENDLMPHWLASKLFPLQPGDAQAAKLP
jgi:hypothetical protein